MNLRILVPISQNAEKILNKIAKATKVVKDLNMKVFRGSENFLYEIYQLGSVANLLYIGSNMAKSATRPSSLILCRSI